MSDRESELREAIRKPLRLPYNPLFRFYDGGSLTRRFRGLAEGTDDYWSEDWVGSCTCANNEDPDGRTQGLSTVELAGIGSVPLKELVEILPGEMVGENFAERWGRTTGVLVKVLSPSGPVPCHAHPTRAWARQHLGSPYGKTEAWIFLETPGDGQELAYAGVGFVPGVDRQWFTEAVRRHDNLAIRRAVHRTEVQPGEVYVAHAGLPHLLGPRLLFIEVQEPSDHIVIAETSGADDAGASMGLGWDEALDMIDYTAVDAETTFARARQQPSVIRTSHESRELRLVNAEVLEFFDVTALEVADEIEVADGRFSVAIVVEGSGYLEGEFDPVAVRRGDTFALPASVPHNVRAGSEPLRVVRCSGPGAGEAPTHS
jgi:mannose-6-phosphate isomerase